MSGIINKREWAALMLIRVEKEPSRALPRHAYMDPAQSVMFERERAARPDERKSRLEQRGTSGGAHEKK